MAPSKALKSSMRLSHQWACPGPKIADSTTVQKHSSPPFRLGGFSWHGFESEVAGWGCAKVIPLSLVSDKAGYCRESNVMDDAQQGESLSAQMPTIHCFQSLFNDPEFSDIKIKAEDAVFFAHRAVLAAHSPSFKAMFMSDMREKQAGEVHLPDTGKEAFEVCLGFMYGRLETISPDLLLPVFQLADAHQVSHLRAICVEQLLSSISADNIVDFMVSADSCCEESLTKACLVYAAHNSDEVVEAPGMKQMMQTNAEVAHKLMVAMVKSKRRKIS